MTARPILFSAPMVRALLDGRKTQTRRTLKHQPLDVLPMRKEKCGREWVTLEQREPEPRGKVVRCRFGLPGDLLWVRETLCRNREPDGHDDEGRGLWAARYAADQTQVPEYLALGMWCPLMALHGFQRQPRGFSVPSIHMPRAYSRLTLRITDVSVERLQDISEFDCYDEGIARPASLGLGSDVTRRDNARIEYAGIWKAINGADSWRANPWVWAISFAVLKQNVDQVMRAVA